MTRGWIKALLVVCALLLLAGALRHDLANWSASQGMAVEREDLSFALHSLLQDAQLAAADGGQDIAQAVVFEAKVSWTNCCSRPDMWGREREIHVRGQRSDWLCRQVLIRSCNVRAI